MLHSCYTAVLRRLPNAIPGMIPGAMPGVAPAMPGAMPGFLPGMPGAIQGMPGLEGANLFIPKQARMIDPMPYRSWHEHSTCNLILFNPSVHIRTLVTHPPRTKFAMTSGLARLMMSK